jgi:hypothetical protein
MSFDFRNVLNSVVSCGAVVDRRVWGVREGRGIGKKNFELEIGIF